MSVFFFFVFLLLSCAWLFILPPLLGWHILPGAEARRQRQNETSLAVLREQRQDLENDRQSGRLSEEEFQKAGLELERRALEEGLQKDEGSDVSISRGWLVALFLLLPLGGLGLYAVLGVPDGLSPVSRQAAADDNHPQITPEQLERLVNHLQAEPADVKGWVMLAQAYILVGDKDAVLGGWKRIGALIPDQAQVLSPWAALLAAVNDGDFSGEPERLLRRALEVEPDNSDVLAMMGMAAFQREAFEDAAGYWERMLRQVPRDDPDYASLVDDINHARGKAGLPLLEGGSTTDASQSALPDEATGTQSPVTISGSVSVSPGLVDQISPDQAVFIFVRSSQGGIPLAAIRLPAADLPARFDFSRAQLMRALTAQDTEFTLTVRVSRHSTPEAASGDLEGRVTGVPADAKNVELVINTVLP